MVDGEETLRAAWVPATDPRAHVLLGDLEREYDARYRELTGEPAATELNRYASDLFDPPHGAFLLLLRDGRAVAGGAFMPCDTADGHPRTAEFKRIWTHPEHRRQGLSRRVLHELEREAARRGYRRVYLTTGPRQPEADSLYLSSGYTPLYSVEDARFRMLLHDYEKFLPPVERQR